MVVRMIVAAYDRGATQSQLQSKLDAAPDGTVRLLATILEPPEHREALLVVAIPKLFPTCASMLKMPPSSACVSWGNASVKTRLATT